jgi:hypothetical protein
MVEATIEDLAITTLFGGGTASLSPFQRSPFGFTASPSRASPCDQRGIPPWNPQQRFSKRCCSSRESDAVRRRCCIEHDLAKGFKIQTSTGTEAIVVKIRS